MGECFIMRRGGSIYKLPILSSLYPKDVAVAVIDGQPTSATFSVVVEQAGNPALYEYQWFVDGVAVDGAVAASYTMDDITDAAVHNVHCAVKNNAGMVLTRKATLSASRTDSLVLDTAYPADVNCEVGGTATFEAKVIKYGSFTDCTYQWFVDDVAVESATASTFQMTNVELGKHSVYCTVTNSAGTVRSRVSTLNVDTLILYASGANYDAITGGWVYRYTYDEGEVWQDDICKSTRNAIDLTNFSKLYFEGRMVNGSGDNVGFCIWKSAADNTLRNAVAEKNGSTGNFTIDVSRLSGKYYLGYWVYDSQDGSVNMTKLYLKV